MGKTVLFIGRFQPLHKGHVHAIRQALKKYDKVIVAIGSINKRDSQNPFSFSQRRKMLRAVFKKYRKRMRIIGIPDCRSDKRWVLEVRKFKFNAVLTGNAWVSGCLRRYAPEKPVFLKRTVYNATNIRRRMASGKAWKRLVPREVYKIVAGSC